MPIRLDRSSADFRERFGTFLAAKREASADVERATRAIVDDVAYRGDAALIDATRKFDRLDIDAGRLRELGEDYLDAIAKVAGGKSRVVDKMPGNFSLVGFIRLILPNAKIIHSRRDPVDTCLSCYTKLFGDALSFTYDLTELGRYHRDYQTLMAHWRAILPPLSSHSAMHRTFMPSG